MGNLFGKSKKSIKKGPSQVNDKDRAILDLKIARDKLNRYRKQLGNESAKLKDQIKELLKIKKKERAILLLKLSKMKENNLNQVDNQLLNVHKMLSDIEWQSQNIEIMLALENGTKALNHLLDQMPIDKVESLLEENNEAIEMEREISALLGQSTATLFSEQELEDELQMLMGGPEVIPPTSVVEEVLLPVINATPEIPLPLAPPVPVLPVQDTLTSSTVNDNSEDFANIILPNAPNFSIEIIPNDMNVVQDQPRSRTLEAAL